MSGKRVTTSVKNIKENKYLIIEIPEVGDLIRLIREKKIGLYAEVEDGIEMIPAEEAEMFICDAQEVHQYGNGKNAKITAEQRAGLQQIVDALLKKRKKELPESIYSREPFLGRLQTFQMQTHIATKEALELILNKPRYTGKEIGDILGLTYVYVKNKLLGGQNMQRHLCSTKETRLREVSCEEVARFIIEEMEYAKKMAPQKYANFLLMNGLAETDGGLRAIESNEQITITPEMIITLEKAKNYLYSSPERTFQILRERGEKQGREWCINGKRLIETMMHYEKTIPRRMKLEGFMNIEEITRYREREMDILEKICSSPKYRFERMVWDSE